jgi:hypothetical protein
MKLYPSPLPDLFKGEQLVVVGRYSGKGSSAIVIEGTVNGQTKKFTEDVTFPSETSENEFIPKLWATRRVGYLLDEIRLHGESAELRDEVTDLARKYGIVTPYTAYLIVEDETKRSVPLVMQSLSALGQDRVAQEAAAQNWYDFKNERGGEKALAGARYGNMLKFANAPADSAGGSLDANRALGFSGRLPAIADAAAEPKARLAQYSQEGQGKFVAGRNFFQNNNRWVDAQVQKQQNAKRVRIQFNSSEYFAVAAKTPKTLPWLALGQNVQFVLDDTLYEIYE